MSVYDKYALNVAQVASRLGRPHPQIDPDAKDAQLCLAVDREIAQHVLALEDELQRLKERLSRLETKGQDE